jgi:uncharacterized protein YhbP (UPF0306 family)
MDAVARGFVLNRDTAVLATTSQSGEPFAAPIHYVLDAACEAFIYKSRATSHHVQHLATSSSAAIAIYDHASTFDVKSGIQIRGTVRQVTDEGEMAMLIDLYCDRFPQARAKFDPIEVLVQPGAPSTLFKLVPVSYKFTDSASDRLDREYLNW